ncbi:MAG: HDIG domain-containing protein, partial [Cyanobacteria bacterium]|nr:HDIG domain-containing protein [Cyanobacteriota bacterium]
MSNCHQVKARPRVCLSRRLLSLGLIVVAIMVMSVTTGYRFYVQPRLVEGMIAPQTIRAPKTSQIIDRAGTQAKQKQAEKAVAGAWKVDVEVNEQILKNLRELVLQGNDIRQMMGKFPFEASSVLSLSTQDYLRQANESEWLSILRSLNTSTRGSSIPATALHSPEVFASNAYQRAVQELQALYYAEAPEQLAALLNVVTDARKGYATAWAKLQASENSVYDRSFLSLTDTDWLATQEGVRLSLERILAQGVHPGYDKSMKESFIRSQLSQTVPAEAENLAYRLLAAVVRPNLQRDEQRSNELIQQAVNAVAPDVITVSQGEIIVQAGETVTAQQVTILEHFRLNRRGIHWGKFLLFMGLVSFTVGGFWFAGQRIHTNLRLRDYVLILLLSLSSPLLLVVNDSSTSMQAIGLLLGSFYGSAIGILAIVFLTILLPIGTTIPITVVLPSAIGGILGSLVAGQLRMPFGDSSRTREELALMGGVVGIAQGIADFLLTTKYSGFWYIELRDALLSGLTGLAWSIFALGLSPYLERLFDIVTPIRLAELANPNRPLLKRLALETPGTFQHTLHVAVLAEAAARTLGCNVELVRTGTLYHDIGKMHDPLGFIENQMGGVNKHDIIQDPWVSADIIKKHVTQGLVMARQAGLPSAVTAFIPEHQGTTLISYFYHQAQQLAARDHSRVLLEADFRYDGPIPQSRETGIVMVADSCEAALRSLKDVTPEEALAVINRILRAKW